MAKARKKISKPVWLKYSESEVKDIILSLIKKTPELTSEKIGLILRDSYGIPTTRIYNFKISAVLKEAGVHRSADLVNLEKKEKGLENHLSKNKKDMKTARSLITIKSRLKRLKECLA